MGNFFHMVMILCVFLLLNSLGFHAQKKLLIHVILFVFVDVPSLHCYPHMYLNYMNYLVWL